MPQNLCGEAMLGVAVAPGGRMSVGMAVAILDQSLWFECVASCVHAGVAMREPRPALIGWR